MASPKELSRVTLDLFESLVPNAVPEAEAVYTVGRGQVRVKRCKKRANQVHVCNGEPIVAHVPSTGEWYVLPVVWQLDFAVKNAKTKKQHASHAVDCMVVERSDFPVDFKVTSEDLAVAAERAANAAQDPLLRVMLKAITRARDAVANVLIETIQEELNG